MLYKEEKHIIYIPILLMLSLLLLPLLDQRKDKATSTPTYVSEQTGFLDYDLLPDELKQEMKRLQKQDATNTYYFAYFFEEDDVNHRYYITDAQHKVVKKMPVIHQEALALVEEKMAEDQGRGYAISFDTSLFSNKAEVNASWYQGRVAYIIPENKAHASFQKLRVGIFKEQYPAWLAGFHNAYSNSVRDTKTYRLSEVEEVPRPIRGIDYFKEVVTSEIRKNASFIYDSLSGDVVVEFTIGSKAKSPQVIKGFSTYHGDYEAYHADGAIVKAINNSKVHWITGKRRGKYVDVRMAMTLSFKKQNQEILLSMSDLQDATEAW